MRLVHRAKSVLAVPTVPLCLHRVRQELDAVHTALQESESARSALKAQLEASQAAGSDRVTALEVQLSGLQQAAGDAEALSAQLEGVLAQRDALESELEAVKAEVGAVNASLAQAQAASQSLTVVVLWVGQFLKCCTAAPWWPSWSTLVVNATGCQRGAAGKGSCSRRSGQGGCQGGCASAGAAGCTGAGGSP